MTQLQNLYEAILELKFDRRNFYKKMLSLGYLIPLDEKVASVSQRATRYFSFDKKQYFDDGYPIIFLLLPVVAIKLI